ncbi:MAG: hypothetical protein PHF35_00700 [Candidatus Moranbacteria bacterium]|nr:hypothetical protein [Candidatus Moranbacteria bacterium]
MFEHFKFSRKQIEKYHKSAQRDFRIASEANVAEVSFRFCYDALLKLAIAVCASQNLRVKSRRGHHIELIKKLSSLLSDSEVEVFANEMRAKRNWDLYGGGAIISKKEADEYLKWTKSIFSKADRVLHGKQARLKI